MSVVNYIQEKGILTNAVHDTIKEIFHHNCSMFEVNRNSLIGGRNAAREKVSELVFTNIPNAEHLIKK